MSSRAQRLIAATVAVIAAASVSVFALTKEGEAVRSSSPGVSAGVSAFDRLPPVANVPPEVDEFIGFAARGPNVDQAKARAGLRLLRTGLGQDGKSVYAFRNELGSPCFVLAGEGGACAPKPENGTPGLHWLIGGGSADQPASLVGIVADDVTEVQLQVDGALVPVSIANNVAFAEYSAAAEVADIVVVRRDGTRSGDRIDLQG